MDLNRLLAIMGLVCLLHSNPVYAQEQFTISGYLKDASNGEVLIGATVRIHGQSIGTITNVYGFYSITLNKGNYVLDFRYVGYVAYTQSVELSSNARLDIELKPSEQQLEAVVISGKAADDNISNIEMSTAELDIKSIQKMPAFAEK